MFTLAESEVAAIRTAFDNGGDEAAAAELCRLFPAFIDRADAQSFAAGIASWRPGDVPVPEPAKAKRTRPR